MAPDSCSKLQWPGYPPFNRVVTTVVDGRQITRLELLCRVADIVKLFFAFVQVLPLVFMHEIYLLLLFI